MSSRANQITTNAIRTANLQGCNVSRSNTMGVFDPKVATEKLWKIVQSPKATRANIQKALQESYRKSHERLGKSDATGFDLFGRFMAIEIKWGKDELSIYQNQYLKEVADKTGLAFIIAQYPEKVKFKVYGSHKIIVTTDELFSKVLHHQLHLPF